MLWWIVKFNLSHISVYFWVIIGRISDELVTNIEFIRIFNKSISFMAPFSKVSFLVSILLLALIPNQIHPNSYPLFLFLGKRHCNSNYITRKLFTSFYFTISTLLLLVHFFIFHINVTIWLEKHDVRCLSRWEKHFSLLFSPTSFIPKDRKKAEASPIAIIYARLLFN